MMFKNLFRFVNDSRLTINHSNSWKKPHNLITHKILKVYNVLTVGFQPTGKSKILEINTSKHEDGMITNNL